MIRVIFVFLLLAVGAPAFGQMYKWTDKDGKTHYSDKPPPQGSGTQPLGAALSDVARLERFSRRMTQLFPEMRLISTDPEYMRGLYKFGEGMCEGPFVDMAPEEIGSGGGFFPAEMSAAMAQAAHDTICPGVGAQGTPSCRIQEYGVATPATAAEAQGHPDAASGKVFVIRQHSQQIPARLGVRFGVLHVFRGVPAGRALEVIITHPPMARASGGTQTVSRAEADGFSSATIYSFDSPSELLPGQWSFEFKYGGRRLCLQQFVVVAQ